MEFIETKIDRIRNDRAGGNNFRKLRPDEITRYGTQFETGDNGRPYRVYSDYATSFSKMNMGVIA